ncbi:L,D-transpeptidase family protein [Sphingomonas sp. SFZ2018-12]|uniref:L,D-transpeptidase family protein n=1 Tax=Sphingomonas sp. SFZ2018-12 TaxID=2683197 RepID=UPI001F10DD9A|nr:L,D-transpeptidase family protein [Sphingomonas sp. SFZ2018-12]
MTHLRTIAAGLGAALTLATATVADARQVSGLDVERAAISMRPGQSFWSADRGDPRQPVRIVVSLPMQQLFVYRGRALIGASTISSGTRAKPTPVGEFTILQKRPFHRSNLYSDAPMPFMQRLTWDGIALHGGDLPGYPASHGCIRLPTDFARELFALTGLGAEVAVLGRAVPYPAFRPQLAAPMLNVAPDLLADESLASVSLPRFRVNGGSARRP